MADADKDVFEYLSQQLQALPQEIKKEYVDITVKTVDTYFATFERNLRSTSGSVELNKTMKVDKPYKPTGDEYIRRLDWDDKTIVNEARGKKWGTYRDKPRAKGKRNYSIVPATYHDLAYITNYGYIDSITGDRVQGNFFITKASRKLKKWKNSRDRKFDKYLNTIKKG